MPCKHLNALLNEKNVSSRGIIVIMLRTRAEKYSYKFSKLILTYVFCWAWASARALPMRALHIFLPFFFRSRSLARLSFSLVFFCVSYPVIQHCTLICSHVIYILFEHKMTNDENSLFEPTTHELGWGIASTSQALSSLFPPLHSPGPRHMHLTFRAAPELLCICLGVKLNDDGLHGVAGSLSERIILPTFLCVTAMKKKSNMQQQLRAEMKKNNLVYI